MRNFIKNQTIPNGCQLVSLDVKSLYTGTLTNVLIDIIYKRLHKLKEFTPLTKDQFKIASNFCLDNTYFIFNGKIFNQIHGTAVMANLVMEELENTVLEKSKIDVAFLSVMLTIVFWSCLLVKR